MALNLNELNGSITSMMFAYEQQGPKKEEAFIEGSSGELQQLSSRIKK